MSFDFTSFLNYISVSPKQFIVCAASIGLGLGLTWKQFSEHQTNWVETTARLGSVNLDNVGDEYYLVKAYFNYAVDGSSYSALSQESFRTKELADDRVRLIKEFKGTTTLFYNQHNPKKAIFFLDEVQMSWEQYGMLIFIAIIAFTWSAWMMKARYDYLG